MKISKIAKKSLFFSVSLVFAGLLASCGTTSTAVTEETVTEVTEPEEVAPVEEPEPKIEEPAPVVEEPVVQNPVADDEYTRSVGDVGVDRDTFVSDKEQIQKIIKELDLIMRDSDYTKWRTYVDDESIQYWSKPANLKKARLRSPTKDKLNSLRDYFQNVFIKARVGKEITEIRYISDKYVKAVQTRENQPDLIYYYFNKIGGKWMVHIPPLED